MISELTKYGTIWIIFMCHTSQEPMRFALGRQASMVLLTFADQCLYVNKSPNLRCTM